MRLVIPRSVFRSADAFTSSASFCEAAIAVRLGVILLPVGDRHVVAADLHRHADLTDAKIEPALSDYLADRLWARRIAGAADWEQMQGLRSAAASTIVL